MPGKSTAALKFSVVVIFHNMRREAKRTLYSLSAPYQSGMRADEYEVIAVDNGSSQPLDSKEVESFGPNFRYMFYKNVSPSPVAAINHAVRATSTPIVFVGIDGARTLSPGLLNYALRAFQAFTSPLVYTLGWHLGQKLQNLTMTEGYTADEEDRLLEGIDWERNGYRLFEISALGDSYKNGFFSPISESNFFGLRREDFERLGGFDEQFQLPGGGLANLDFFKRAMEFPHLEPVLLLGEGTFHQVHGGVSTNVPWEKHPWPIFHDDYVRIRGAAYEAPTRNPHYLGHVPVSCKPFIKSPKLE